MKDTFLKNLKKLGSTVLMVFALTMLAQISAFAQETLKQDQSEELTEKEFSQLHKGNRRTLEGSWSVQTKIFNCQTGATFEAFPKMNTFMQGGTSQEFSAGSAGFLRGPAHGVWYYEGGQYYSYALQFFRFNPDRTYAGLTRARWHVYLSPTGNSYTANTITIEIINPAGVVVNTVCGSETGTRFE